MGPCYGMFQMITRQWNREGARLNDHSVLRHWLITHHCWWFQLRFWEMSRKHKEIAFGWRFIVWKLSLLPVPLHCSGCTPDLVSSTGQHWPRKRQHMAPSKKAHCCLVTVRHCFKHSCHQKKKTLCEEVDASLIIVLMFCNTYLLTNNYHMYVLVTDFATLSCSSVVWGSSWIRIVLGGLQQDELGLGYTTVNWGYTGYKVSAQ